MKILLIKPSLTVPERFIGFANFYPPIGLGYMASSLEKNGYEVKILDAGIEKWRKLNVDKDGIKYVGMDWKEVEERIRQENPDVVGINILTVHSRNAYITAKIVKKVNKNILVIAGGPHVPARPEEVISNPYIDVIVLGEGELTMVDIVKTFEKNKSFKDVKGIWYKKNGKTRKNEPRPLIQNLDELPFPAWHLLNIEKYFESQKCGQFSQDAYGRMFPMITSRSCPFACIFCSIRLIMGRGFRPRSPENVIEEIKQLVQKYDIEHISFQDDNLTLNKSRVEKICDLIVKENLKITWSAPNGVRADMLDEGLLRKMKKSGCNSIFIAPESGSQEVINNIIGKRLDLKQVENIVRLCRKIGISCGCFFMVGLPGETIEQIKETVNFAKRMKSLGAHTCGTIAQPYFGTTFYDICKEKGYLTKDDKDLPMSFLNFEAVVKTPNFTPEQLYKYKDMIQKDNKLSLIKRELELIRISPVRAFYSLLVYLRFLIIK
jgi:magnesium-protoporphyrin IX monomethyl ester (oxidative) cyclase